MEFKQLIGGFFICSAHAFTRQFKLLLKRKWFVFGWHWSGFPHVVLHGLCVQVGGKGSRLTQQVFMLRDQELLLLDEFVPHTKPHQSLS